jgi:hypothetical protein
LGFIQVSRPTSVRPHSAVAISTRVFRYGALAERPELVRWISNRHSCIGPISGVRDRSAVLAEAVGDEVEDSP